MAKNRSSVRKRERDFQKRQRELKKAEKAARKRERRLNRGEPDVSPSTDAEDDMLVSGDVTTEPSE